MATDDQDKAIREIAERHSKLLCQGCLLNKPKVGKSPAVIHSPEGWVCIAELALAALREACEWQREKDAAYLDEVAEKYSELPRSILRSAAAAIRRGGQNG